MDTRNIYGDQLEFRQIVLKHIQKILDLSTTELRDKTVVRNYKDYSETIESEDSRKSYIQAIENLSFVLLPYFDDDMGKVYEECIEVIGAMDFEIRDLCKKDYDKVCRELKKENLGKGFAIEMKMRFAKELFIELNLLLKRNDYLKSVVYGEDKDEVAVEDEKEGVSE